MKSMLADLVEVVHLVCITRVEHHAKAYRTILAKASVRRYLSNQQPLDCQDVRIAKVPIVIGSLCCKARQGW